MYETCNIHEPIPCKVWDAEWDATGETAEHDAKGAVMEPIQINNKTVKPCAEGGYDVIFSDGMTLHYEHAEYAIAVAQNG